MLQCDQVLSNYSQESSSSSDSSQVSISSLPEYLLLKLFTFQGVDMHNDNPQVNPKKLFIGSLPFSATEEQLRDLFSPHGDIIDLKIIIDRYTGQSKGIAFIEYSTAEQAEAAISAVHESEMDGRKLVVNVARPPRPRQDRGFGGGQGRQNRF